MKESTQAFLTYLDEWQSGLISPMLNEIIPNPDRGAIISVDLINGFCTEGVLSSPRVQAIVNPVTRLMKNAWSQGVRNIVLTQDTHEPDAVEFAAFAPHCVRGTSEAETVPEIMELPFFEKITVIEKNSIHSGLDTGLEDWIAERPQVDTFIVVGDCTDLCTYQLAMYLQLDANARQLKRKIIIPADCVATYDLPVAIAKQIGAFPHDGDLLHQVFLYHMALNGIQVYSSIK